jgi:tetratricopeptide (TPR) repeat protein
VETWVIQARLASQLGRNDEAERLARRGLEADPRRADIQVFLADLLIRQDRLEDAAQCLRTAVALRPEIGGGYSRLGMVLDRLGDREGARKALEMAIQHMPSDATAFLVLGRLLLDQDRTGDALLHLEKARQLDPKLSGAYYALSQAQSRLGAAEAARDSMNKFLELKRVEKAELDAQNTDYDDEKFMRVLAAGFHTEVAGFFVRRQQAAVAEAHLRQALRIAPQETRGYEVLAAFLVQAGRPAESRELYEALVRLKPRQAGYHLSLGTVLLQLDDHPAGVEELKRALELDPKQPEALANLARFYLNSRRELPEALNLCRRLVGSQPTAASYDLLGWACYANGLTNEARAAAGQAVERDPTNTVYRERLQRLQPKP